MKKRFWQNLILVGLVSFFTLLQFSFISALPDPFRQFNLILIILVFALFFLDFHISLISALVAGFWLDVMSFHFFGFYITIFFLSLLFAQWILKDWLTNRSFYSLLAIMAGSTIFYNILAAAILYMFSADYTAFFLVQKNFWLIVAYQLVWSFLSSLVLFNLATLVSKRVKPFFLEKKSFM